MKTPGLLGRSILASVLVATVAVLATALLTLNVTRNSLERQQVRVQDVDKAIVERLVDHGRSQPGWSDVEDLLGELAPGRDALLTTLEGRRLATSGAEIDDTIDPSDPSAVLDPLADVVAQAAEEIPRSGRTLGLPRILLQSRQQEGLLRPPRRDGYPESAVCANDPDVLSTWVREDVDVLTTVVPDCADLLPVVETGGSGPARELAVLNNAVVVDEYQCLERRGVGVALVRRDPTDASAPVLLTLQVAATRTGLAEDVAAAWQDCATSVLTRRLGPVVAPDALLYLSETRLASTKSVDQVGLVRISSALGAVLLAVVGASLFASRRVLRPVHHLTLATREMADGRLSTRVPVAGGDEVARLGRSFNEMAQALAHAEDQRRRMVADIAHELRTPLSNIRGYLEAGQDRVLARDDAWTASLLEETGLLQHVIDDLQVLAESDAGRLQVHPDETDLGTTVDLALQSLRAHADAGGVRLERTGASVALVAHDRMRIRQVVANLVSNAVRHSPAGEVVTVDLSTVDGTRDGTGDGVRIEVRDRGPGVPEEHQPHVFERFYRADPSRSRATGGSGLGLAIVEQIVNAHEGRVSVRNVSGGGASFIVELPTSPSGSPPAP